MTMHADMQVMHMDAFFDREDNTCHNYMHKKPMTDCICKSTRTGQMPVTFITQ